MVVVSVFFSPPKYLQVNSHEFAYVFQKSTQNDLVTVKNTINNNNVGKSLCFTRILNSFLKKTAKLLAHGGVVNVDFFLKKESEQAVAMMEKNIVHHTMVNLHVSVTTLRSLGAKRVS